MVLHGIRDRVGLGIAYVGPRCCSGFWTAWGSGIAQDSGPRGARVLLGIWDSVGSEFCVGFGTDTAICASCRLQRLLVFESGTAGVGIEDSGSSHVVHFVCSVPAEVIQVTWPTMLARVQ